MSDIGLEKSIRKMHAAGITGSFIDVFTHYYKLQEKVLSSENNNQNNSELAYIREKDIEPLTDIVTLEELQSKCAESDDFNRVNGEFAIIKLNGGLGTTMGLDGYKSLLEVRNSLTFIDIIIKTIQKQRIQMNAPFPLIFMNSFNTSDETMHYIRKHFPDFFDFQTHKEFIQHQEPKLTLNNLEPVNYPKNKHLEWCPPGHGDFYNAFYSSGVLKSLIDQGYKYAFVSNSDNLGAIYDSHIASYFSSSNCTIMLELTPKTDKDIKGGHIVKKNGKKILREVAQIHPDDKNIAFNKEKHPYFNTNSIWLNLTQLYEILIQNNGIIDMPLISNIKTVNPKDPNTEKCVQMEYAIGAGVNSLDTSGVICVPRSRFIGVKTNDDLAALANNPDLSKIIESCV